MNLEEQLDEAIRDVVAIVNNAGDVYFKEAAAKYLIRELSWALISESADIGQDEVADQLDGMADLIRKHEPGKAET